MNTDTAEIYSEESYNYKLPGVIQQLLAIYAFFLAFPCIDIFGISITFFIFLVIIAIHVFKRIQIVTPDKTNKWFILLFSAGTLSTLFHPPLDIEVSIMADVKTISQFFYWFLLAMYVRSNFYLIDWWRLSKYFLWGIVALIIGFYYSPFKIDLDFIKIGFKLSRNGFIYNMLSFIPFTMWYMRYSNLRRIYLLILCMFVLSILFSNGRAGFVLILIQVMLIGLILYPRFRGIFLTGIFALAFTFVIWQFYSEAGITSDIADIVRPVNKRAAAMIAREGYEGDLSLDKSWQLRRLMVDKAVETVREYPLFGVGWLHFENYFARFETLGNYPRLLSHGDKFLNTRSSHNSYAMYLAEGGIIGFMILLVILFITFKPLTRKFLKNSLSESDLPMVSMLILAIYFYVITSITGANTWFVIGASLGCAGTYLNSKNE